MVLAMALPIVLIPVDCYNPIAVLISTRLPAVAGRFLASLDSVQPRVAPHPWKSPRCLHIGSRRCNDVTAIKLARIRPALTLISPANSDSLLGNVGKRAALYLSDGVLVQIDNLKRR